MIKRFYLLFSLYLLFLLSVGCEAQPSFIQPIPDVQPTSYSGLQFWIDANQLVGYVDGQEITSATDFSGNSATLTPGSAAKRPTYETGEVNGRPAMLFAPNDNLVGVNAKYDYSHQGSNTFVFVIKPTVETLCYLLDDTNDESSSSVGRTILINSTAKISDKILAGTSGQNVFTATTVNNVLPANQWHVVVIKYDHTLTSNVQEIYVDNNLVVVGVKGTLSPSASTAFTTPKFFSNASGLAGYSGYVAEFFGYNVALNDQQIKSLTASLSKKYALSIPRFPMFLSNGKSLTISPTDEVLISGSGTIDYPGFPSFRIIGNTIHLVYKYGSAHNATNDASIMYWRGVITPSPFSIDWTFTPVAIVPAVSDYYLTNPSMIIGQSNRVWVQFQRLVPNNRLGFEFDYRLKVGAEVGGGQEMWYIYSDDGGNTWSSQFRFANTYVAPDIMLGTGEGINVNGVLYQMTHGRSATAYYGGLYKSVNNGINWTLVSNMYTNTPVPTLEEPTLYRSQDGFLFCYARSGADKTTKLIYSTNDGVTSSTYAETVFSSDSKPSIGVFPSKSLAIGGRNELDLSRRSTVNYTTNGKHFTEYNLDSRTEISMYMSMDYHVASGKMIVIYAVVSPGGTLVDGPAKLIWKTMTEN